MKNSEGRDYLHFFKIPFILFAILLVITVFFRLAASKKKEIVYIRGNNECTTERVFDYADKLTDTEEDALRQKIAEAQEKIGCDIVVVILEESLAEYAKSYEPIIGSVEPYQYTMVYADNFYDENRFGFDRPVGDGILLLDNWYREADGGLYSWISTSGRVYEHYSTSMIDSLMNAFIEEVQIDPASGYERFVELVAEEMDPNKEMLDTGLIPWWMALPIGAVAALVFFFVNFGGKKGRKTVNASTYVSTGKPKMGVREDQFLTKTVTRRKIQTSSGSGGTGGGGGGHVSAGGHVHGGGGGRR